MKIEKQEPFLYKIKNQDGNVYIGQTIQGIERIKQHIVKGYNAASDTKNLPAVKEEGWSTKNADQELFKYGISVATGGGKGGVAHQFIMQLFWIDVRALKDNPGWVHFASDSRWTFKTKNKVYTNFKDNKEAQLDFWETIAIISSAEKLLNIEAGGQNSFVFKPSSEDIKNGILPFEVELGQFRNKISRSADVKIKNPYYYHFYKVFLDTARSFEETKRFITNAIENGLFSANKGDWNKERLKQILIKTFSDIKKDWYNKALRRYLKDSQFSQIEARKYIPDISKISFSPDKMASAIMQHFPTPVEMLIKSLTNKKHKEKYDIKLNNKTYSLRSKAYNNSFVFNTENISVNVVENDFDPSQVWLREAMDVFQRSNPWVQQNEDWEGCKDLVYNIGLSAIKKVKETSAFTGQNGRYAKPLPIVEKIEMRKSSMPFNVMDNETRKAILKDILSIWHYENYNWIAGRKKNGEIYRIQGIAKKDASNPPEQLKAYKPLHDWSTIEDHIEWNGNLSSTKDMRYW